jgi:hypothetical protein
MCWLATGIESKENELIANFAVLWMKIKKALSNKTKVMHRMGRGWRKPSQHFKAMVLMAGLLKTCNSTCSE